MCRAGIRLSKQVCVALQGGSLLSQTPVARLPSVRLGRQLPVRQDCRLGLWRVQPSLAGSPALVHEGLSGEWLCGDTGARNVSNAAPCHGVASRRPDGPARAVLRRCVARPVGTRRHLVNPNRLLLCLDAVVSHDIVEDDECVRLLEWTCPTDARFIERLPI